MSMTKIFHAFNVLCVIIIIIIIIIMCDVGKFTRKGT